MTSSEMPPETHRSTSTRPLTCSVGLVLVQVMTATDFVPIRQVITHITVPVLLMHLRLTGAPSRAMFLALVPVGVH